MPDHWLAIVNPNAGVKKGTRDYPLISKLFEESGVQADCVFTERRGHAIEQARVAIEKGTRNIVVVGGDGTLNEVLNGVIEQKTCDPLDISLGMIPVGTGNDWCRSFRIPFDYRQAVEVLKQKRTFVQDVGKVTFRKHNETITRYFMNVAGMGYDALVAKKTNLLKEKGKGGPAAYMYFVFASLFQYKFMDARIRIDNEEVYNGGVFSMNIGICKFNGGGMKQVPFAVPDDGLLDVTLIKKASKFLVIRYAHKLYDGSLVELPIVKTFRGKKIEILSTGNIYLETDGESMGHTPMTFEILEKKIRVVGIEMVK